MEAKVTPTELIERLESDYDFECTGGPLRSCVEWQELKTAVTASNFACPGNHGGGPHSCQYCGVSWDGPVEPTSRAWPVIPVHFQLGEYSEVIKVYRCVCGGYWNVYPNGETVHRDPPAPNVQQRTGEETV